MSQRVTATKPATDDSLPGVRQGREAIAKANRWKTLSTSVKKGLQKEDDVNKKALIEMEEDNFTRILMQKSNDGWGRLLNNSAVILSKWLDGKLGRSYNLKEDKSYGEKAKYGTVSIKPEGMADLIQRLDMKGIKLTSENEWMMEFQLGARVSKEEMIRLLNEKELLVEKTNELVMPGGTIPELRSHVRLLLIFVHEQIRGQKESTKNAFLNDMEKLVVRLNCEVVAAARGEMNVDEMLAHVEMYVGKIYGYAVTMMDLKLIDPKQYKTFVDRIKGVENERARMIRRKRVEEEDKKAEEAKRRVEK